MMARYFIGFIASIGLIILLIILLFHGGGKPKVPTTSKTLDSYAVTNAEVRMTIDGPINADQSHQQVRVTVSRDSAVFEQIQGYQGHVVNTKSYGNNSDAYTNFLLALTHAGFTQGTTTSALKDERGYCAEGDRYIFELIQNGQDLERYWTTSCGSPKTYSGSTNLTLRLFKDQIPGYNDLVGNLNL